MGQKPAGSWVRRHSQAFISTQRSSQMAGTLPHAVQAMGRGHPVPLFCPGLRFLQTGPGTCHRDLESGLKLFLGGAGAIGQWGGRLLTQDDPQHPIWSSKQCQEGSLRTAGCGQTKYYSPNKTIFSNLQCNGVKGLHRSPQTQSWGRRRRRRETKVGRRKTRERNCGGSGVGAASRWGAGESCSREPKAWTQRP